MVCCPQLLSCLSLLLKQLNQSLLSIRALTKGHHLMFTATSCWRSEGQRLTFSWVEQKMSCSTVLSVPQGERAAGLAAPKPAHWVLPPF